MRVVLDTSVLVSAVVYRGEVPRRVLEVILDRHVPLLSPELEAEYAVTMKKPKFDRKDPGGVWYKIF